MGQRMRDRGCRIEDAGQEGLWYLPSAFGGVREPCSFYRLKSASIIIWERIGRVPIYTIVNAISLDRERNLSCSPTVLVRAVTR